MVAVEHFMSQVNALPSQQLDSRRIGNFTHLLVVLAHGDSEDREQYIDGSQVGRFVNTQTYVTILEVVQIHLFA